MEEYPFLVMDGRSGRVFAFKTTLSLARMDTGGACATQATTMFTTVQTLSRSKLATFKGVTLTANASRGTSPHTSYEWSTPGWTLTFAPNDRASSVSITLPDISGTDPVEQRTVTVMVKVTDANGKVGRDKHYVVVNP